MTNPLGRLLQQIQEAAAAAAPLEPAEIQQPEPEPEPTEPEPPEPEFVPPPTTPIDPTPITPGEPARVQRAPLVDPNDIEALEESHARHEAERTAGIRNAGQAPLPNGVVPNVVIRIPAPRDFQPEVLDHPARFKAIRAGRRRGKTRLEFIAAVRGHGPFDENGVRKYRGMAQQANIIWLAPDYGQSGEIWEKEVLPRFAGRQGVTISEKHRLIGLGRSVGETELGEPIYKGSIRVRSAENIDSVRGGEYDGAIVEEAAHLDFFGIWKRVLRPTLITTKGWAIIASTTKLGSDFNQLMADVEAGKRGKNWQPWHYRTKDSPYIDAEELAELAMDYPPGSVEEMEELDAELLETMGTLFKKEWFDEYDAISYDAVWIGGLRYQFEYLVMAVDLAASLKQRADFTAFTIAGVCYPVDGFRRVAIIEVVNERLEGPDQIDAMDKIARRYRPAFIDIEATQYQLTAVQHLERKLKSTGLVVEGVNLKGDKRTKAVPAATAMSRHLWYFPKDAPWKSDTVQQLLKFPNGKEGSKLVADHDDIVDTFGILAARVGGRTHGGFRIRKLKGR